MKPTKLIISAFGPYAGKMPEINFEEFDEKGLFLISGNTGAGKTMIFDAICFALFGKTSMANRDEKFLRSEYADENTESFVEFHFTHQGREYVVSRWPSYIRKKQRGEGFVPQQGRASFQEKGQLPIDGINNVNEAVKNLLNIDVNQFKQIAMIAQGEFFDLLNAKTDKRTEILRTIFQTSGYQRMEFILKGKMDASKEKADNIARSVAQYFNDVSVAPDDPVFPELEEQKKNTSDKDAVWDIDLLVDMIDKTVKSETARKDALTEDLKKADVELNKNKEKLAQAKTNNDFIERLEKLSQEEKELTAQAPEMKKKEELLTRQKAASREANPFYVSWMTKSSEAKKTEELIAVKTTEKQTAKEQADLFGEQLKKAESRTGEADELKKKILKITEDEKQYEKKEACENSLKELEKDSRSFLEQEAELKEKEAALKIRSEELKKTIAGLEGKPVERENASAYGRKCSDLSSEIKAILDKQVKERTKRANDLKSKQDAYIAASSEYDALKNELDQAEKILECCRAGILAKDLKEGEKCPVCGSEHHPQLAVLPEESITEEQIEEIKTRESEGLNKKNAAVTAAEVAKTALSEYEDQMIKGSRECLQNELLNVLTDDKELDDLLSDLKSADARLTEMIKENTILQNSLLKECEILKASKEEFDAIADSLNSLVKEKEELAENKRRTEKQIVECQTTLKNLSSLSYPDKKTAEKEKAAAQTAVDEIDKFIKNSMDAKTKADQDLTAVSAELKTLEGNLLTQKKDEKDLLDSLNRTLAELKFASCEEMLLLVSDENTLSQTEKEINEFKQAQATNKTQLAQAEKDAKGRTLVDIEDLQALCENQEAAVKDLRKKENVLSNRIKTNEEKKTNILAQSKDFDSSKHDYLISERLYKLVRGTTKNGKITLEQYIQAAGFDGIIAAANRRLLPMSDQQYELRRKTDSIGLQSNTFLDLEVLDHYTGKARPVGNLSGGESFKASLSLALGLSDTVSSNLGGVQMDALFVDEGFGTLDQKSIESTLDVLTRLTNANKLVGVISHRQELIAGIPQQIHVEKTPTGSTFKVDRGL
ncbi:MAG: SMC family ATPase [Clostridiales bacterium]|nr:SMC family ATPase [Clostridiales bacterium]